MRRDLSSQADDGYISYYMTDTTTTTYYLHSAVLGGKIIAELNQSGLKTKGHVYSGGAQIATQTLWTGGSSVELESTNPVTGAVTTTDANGTYVAREEPDPLGRELAAPPDPDLIIDPLAGRKMVGPMPIEASWGPSQEFLNNNQAWANDMDIMQLQNATSGTVPAKATILLILENNPNIGISHNGGRTLYGSDAAHLLIDFKGALNSAETPGDREALGSIKVSADPQNTVPITVRYMNQKYVKDFQKALTEAENRLQKPDCAKLFGKSAADLVNMLENTEYRVLTLASGGPTVDTNTGDVNVVGAQINSSTSVFINDKGPFFNPVMFVPGKSGPQTLDFNSGLRGSQFGALLLLHELGHQTGIFGSDAGNSKLNREYTRRVQKACF